MKGLRNKYRRKQFASILFIVHRGVFAPMLYSIASGDFERNFTKNCFLQNAVFHQYIQMPCKQKCLLRRSIPQLFLRLPMPRRETLRWVHRPPIRKELPEPINKVCFCIIYLVCSNKVLYNILKGDFLSGLMKICNYTIKK